MAQKTPRFDFRAHLSAGMVDALGLCAAFVVVAAAAVVASWLAPWS
ncbi:MAG TPA: hypothetical protein VFE13_13690 [Caulobacteraceae bacterium]|jgi:hypothetical protein|nr:hypothetical protein [Caulobacteraceae bacterium]